MADIRSVAEIVHEKYLWLELWFFWWCCSVATLAIWIENGVMLYSFVIEYLFSLDIGWTAPQKVIDVPGSTDFDAVTLIFEYIGILPFLSYREIKYNIFITTFYLFIWHVFGRVAASPAIVFPY